MQRQRYSLQHQYDQPNFGAANEGKLERLEKIVERQQNEIELLRTKLNEVSASTSGMATPVQVPPHPGPVYYPYPYPPQLYYNSPPSFVAPPGFHPPSVPGVMRSYRNTDESEMRPSSAAAIFSDRYRDYNNEDDDEIQQPDAQDYWGASLPNNQPQNFRPQSALDRWTENDYSYPRNPFESSTNTTSSRDRIRFNDPSVFFEQKPRINQNATKRPLLPDPIPSKCTYGQENEWKPEPRNFRGIGRGNYRGSGFRGVSRGMGPYHGSSNVVDLGQQARDSLGIMKDSGFPRSSSPNDDISVGSTDSDGSRPFEPKRVTNANYLVVPPPANRKLKGLVDESFMSQQEETNKQQPPPPPPPPVVAAPAVQQLVSVKPEPRPPSILKNGEIVDDSFNSQNSAGNNQKSVTFKFDAEVAAVLDRGRSPFHPGEITPSPTSSASSNTEDLLSVSMLTAPDLSEPNLKGQIVHVVSPLEFYLIVHEHDDLDQELQRYASIKRTRRIYDASKLQDGEMCVVKFKEDGKWYRGSVMVPGKNPEVLLVDYGNTITIENPVQDYLCAYSTDLSHWPVQGRIAQLYGIAPPGRSGTWPEESVAEFKRIVTDVVLNVDVIDLESVQVRLTVETDGTDVSTALIQEALAKKA